MIYPLDEVLLLCLLAVLAGPEDITDIARFGERKLDFCARSGRFATERLRMIALAALHPLDPSGVPCPVPQPLGRSHSG